MATRRNGHQLARTGTRHMHVEAEQALERDRERVRRKRGKVVALGISALRAVRAKRPIQEDMKAARDSWRQSLTSGVAAFVLAGLLAAAAFVVLTAGVVIGLTVVLGAPWGHFVTVAGYLVIAGVVFAVGRGRRNSRKAEAREHVEDARLEVRHATRPVRTAFRGDDSA